MNPQYQGSGEGWPPLTSPFMNLLVSRASQAASCGTGSDAPFWRELQVAPADVLRFVLCVACGASRSHDSAGYRVTADSSLAGITEWVIIGCPTRDHQSADLRSAGERPARQWLTISWCDDATRSTQREAHL